ncbi:MAG: PaaI family thioesterase [Bacillota bacterium]|nr:PaaI family thioesterase [Bacillota bacterium]
MSDNNKTDLQRAREYFGNDMFATKVAGIEITEVGDKYAKLELDLDERHYNAMGEVMGGVCFTMSDFAFAVASNFDQSPCVTLGSQAMFLSRVKGKHLICEARCLKDGRHTCFYEMKVTDELGTAVAVVSVEGYRVGLQK